MPIVQDSSAPLIAITGATGNQGGSVLVHLTSSPNPYRVRAITRDASKPSASSLKSHGAEVVTADLANQTEVEKAFHGADIAFAMTDFWNHKTKDKEVEQGKILADAAKKSNVKLFVWSGLHDAKKISGGRFTHVDHFDGKAEIRKYAEEIGLKVLNVQIACYYTLFSDFLQPHKISDDEYEYRLPVKGTTPVPFIDAQHDFGNYVVSALDLPDSTRPSNVYTASEVADFDSLVDEIARNTGKKVKYRCITAEQYEEDLKQAGFPAPLVQMLSEVWQFVDLFGYYGSDKKTELELQHPVRTAEAFFALDNSKEFLQASFQRAESK